MHITVITPEPAGKKGLIRLQRLARGTENPVAAFRALAGMCNTIPPETTMAIIDAEGTGKSTIAGRLSRIADTAIRQCNSWQITFSRTTQG